MSISTIKIFRRAASGFSLIEVMIALAIMVVAFTVLLGTQNGHLMLSERGEYISRGVVLARTKMSDLEVQYRGGSLPLNDLDENKKPSDKPFGDEYPEYGYHLTIKKVRIPLPASLFQAANSQNTNTGGPTAVNNNASSLAGSASAIGEFLSQAVREVRLSVYWESPAGQDQIEIVTHFVDLNASFGVQ